MEKKGKFIPALKYEAFFAIIRNKIKTKCLDAQIYYNRTRQQHEYILEDPINLIYNWTKIPMNYFL